MPFPAVGDIIRVSYWCRAGTQVGINTDFNEVTAVSTPPISYQALLDRLSNIAGPLYKALLSPQTSYWGASLNQINVTPAPATLYTTNERGIGTLGATNLPLQVTGIIHKATTIQGRANRGRMYVPFPPDVAMTASGEPFPTVAYKNLLDLLADIFHGTQTYSDLANPALTAELTTIIYHPIPGISRNVTAAFGKSLFGTQRRRGNYGQSNIPPF